jgi:hypothetical protein
MCEYHSRRQLLLVLAVTLDLAIDARGCTTIIAAVTSATCDAHRLGVAAVNGDQVTSEIMLATECTTT